MLSHDCHDCKQILSCKKRFVNVRKGEFVYCPDGDRHLVDIDEEWIKK